MRAAETEKLRGFASLAAEPGWLYGEHMTEQSYVVEAGHPPSALMRLVNPLMGFLLRSPLAGLARSGWKLAYDDKPNRHLEDTFESRKTLNFRTTLGVSVNEEGNVLDITPGLPAAKAGVAPGFKIIAVNGRKFSDDVIKNAVKESSMTSEPMELILQNGDTFSVARVDYHGGAKWPHLVRDESKTDVLSAIISGVRRP